MKGKIININNYTIDDVEVGSKWKTKNGVRGSIIVTKIEKFRNLVKYSFSRFERGRLPVLMEDDFNDFIRDFVPFNVMTVRTVSLKESVLEGLDRSLDKMREEF